MKKIFTMVVLALTTLSMSAQEDSKLTIKAGVGLASLAGDDVDVDSKIAFKVGATYDFNISEDFAIVPGAEFICQGYDNGEAVHTYALKVPVLAAYKFNISDNFALSVKAGPYVSYGLFGTDDVYDDQERLDAGVQAGVSTDFGKWTVGLEYSRGFLKAFDGIKAYNQVYGVTVGYKF